MKIGNPADKTAPVVAGNGTAVNQSSTQAAASAIPAQADPSAKIQISSTASTLMNGSSSADFDADKVARIAKSIENGTFKINPEAIADKLISNAHELLPKAS